MRVICLDVGEKRIGVAVSDLLDLTAQGVETIWTKGFERDAERVAALCKQYETDRFAVACADPVARRKELATRYGGCTDDPETEYAAYAAKVASRPVVKTRPAK